MDSPPSWFNVLRARRLSRRGEHAAALALSRLQDVQVLSRAGMHLSVLGKGSADSAELALALANVGQVDEALKIARKTNAPRALMGMLAVALPERVLAHVPPSWTDLSAYCASRVGNLESALSNRQRLSPLHSLYVSLMGRDMEAAQTSFRRLYESSGLVAPCARWNESGLDLGALSCDVPPLSAMPQPLVSVILTAHDEEKHLQNSVYSLLKQDWRNLELIIVDDGSTDGTVKVATELAAQDSRIRVLRMRENGGTWKAKNLALAHARGEFITMHDADDWSHPSKLSLQIEPLLRDTSLMCSSSYFFRVDEDSGLPYTRNAASFLRWNASSLLYRRVVPQEIGNYRDLLGADCEFAERIELRWGIRSHSRVRKPLAIGLQRPASLSSRYRSERDSLRLRHWEQWRREHAKQVAAR